MTDCAECSGSGLVDGAEGRKPAFNMKMSGFPEDDTRCAHRILMQRFATQWAGYLSCCMSGASKLPDMFLDSLSICRSPAG